MPATRWRRTEAGRRRVSATEVLLVYDGQCPLCRNYARRLRIQDAVGRLRLVDARENSAIREAITEQRLDIDQGMVLKIDDTLYYGADALHMLALIGSPSRVFNRINVWLFRSRRLSRWLYPVLRGGRALLLKVLRRSKINNLNLPGNTRF